MAVHHPIPLADSARSSRRAFIVGAGMSAECGAPTITNFLSEPYISMITPENAVIIKEFLDSLDPLENPHNIEQILGIIDDCIINGNSINDYSPVRLKEIRNIFLESINEILNTVWDNINYQLGMEAIDNPYAAFLSKKGGDVVREKTIRALVAELESLSQTQEKIEKSSDDSIDEERPLAEGWIKTYGELIKILRPHDVIINFNYDNFLELALSIKIERHQIDYGFDYFEMSPDTDVLCHGDLCWIIRPPLSEKYQLTVIRPHGSLNWGVCSNCGKLIGTYLTPLLGITPYIEMIKSESPKTKEEHFCCEGFDPQLLIVPPTNLKFYYDRYFSDVVNAAAEKLSECDEIYFLGYSFSGSDRTIRDIIRMALFKRFGKKWDKIVVVNRSIERVEANYRGVFSELEGFKGKTSDFLVTMEKYGKPFRDPPAHVGRDIIL